jgi:hypothetical protein
MGGVTAGRAEAELWATLAALTGEPLADDAARLLTAHPEVAAAADPPLARPARVVETDREGRPTVLHAPLDLGWERCDLVALFNWREGPFLCALPFDRIGLDPGVERLVHDFWGRASLGIATHAVGRRIGARASLLLALRVNQRRPQLVGTERHVAQGALELADLTWDPDAAALSGRAAPQPMSLMLRCPHPFVPIAASGGEVGPLGEARVALTLPAAPVWRDWSVAFGQAPPTPRGQPLRLHLDLPS